MTDKQRKDVVSKVKGKSGWYGTTEKAQDKLIEEVCNELGYNYIAFWATDGLFLYKLLK